LKNIFIIGITGFIGQHLSRELIKSGIYSIKGLTRNNHDLLSQQSENIKYIQGDILLPMEFISHIDPGSIVINLAYLKNQTIEKNLQATRNLVDICISKKIERLIHCSTAVVSGRVKNNIITEQIKCYPGNEYEKTKYQIEQVLIEKTCNHLPLTILRPTAVFGENGQNLLKLANEIKRGNYFLIHLKSYLYNNRKMNLVAIENVVAALKFLISFEQSAKKEVFIISDDDDENNHYQYIKTFLSLRLNSNHSNLPIIKFPMLFLSILQRLFKKSSINPLQIFSSQKIFQAGFQKRITLDTALEKFVEWYQTKEIKSPL
jgi:nucleoside-diphosphate-sugar epimerase